MNVQKITANRDTIKISLDGVENTPKLWIREQVPTVSPDPARQLALLEGTPCRDCGEVVIPRYDGSRDRLFSCFTVWSQDGRQMADGIKYVTDFTPEAHAWDYLYPQAASKKGTHAHGADAKALGVCHATMNVNLCELFSAVPGEDTQPFESNGCTFHVRRAVAAGYDQAVRDYHQDGTNLSMILLASPRLFGADNNPLLNALALHPNYDPEGFISAFNMHTEDGVAYYCAFLDYLASRYMREDARYGRITGFILSNEIDLQWNWGNMGETTMPDYVREYTGALRLAWQTAQKYWSGGRAYISLAHFFSVAADPSKPLRFYKGREVLETLNQYALQEGNFGWSVAYHPYCESFNHPDFWNDRNATFDFTTPRITFKNIEVLPAYLAQAHLLYCGQPRRIIFSEQGFNTFDAFSEEIGYAGYCLAYKKIEAEPTIEAFIYHSYSDNKHEFGLNLGLRRGSDDPDVLGEAKPAWYAMRTMGTPQEAAALEKARAIIGEHMWDITLHPQVIAGNRDTTREQEFGAAANTDEPQ
jgi:hypothetical protein